MSLKLVKGIFKKILIEIIYLTPLGFLISGAMLFRYEKQEGIDLNLANDRKEKTTLKIVENPYFAQRVTWICRGIILLLQAWFLIPVSIAEENNFHNSNFTGGYIILATLFGIISIISAFFPRVPWNKKLF